MHHLSLETFDVEVLWGRGWYQKADGVSIGEEEGDVMSMKSKASISIMIDSSVTAMIADKFSQQIDSLIHQLKDELERLPSSDVNKEGRIQSKIDKLHVSLSFWKHRATISV